jgi:NAD-dependent dihydropyrimidine dehydrogenase PreA subunit
VLRKIIEIDESRCDGCGDCIPSCAEGALAVVEGKVKVVRDMLCDGLGACVGICDKGALRVIEREAERFDEAAVQTHLATRARHQPPPGGPRRGLSAAAAAPSADPSAGGCPGSRPVEMAPRRGLSVLPGDPVSLPARPAVGGSRLTQWPVQLELVSPGAPYFRDADLLVAADCVPFAYARFHDDFLAGKRLVVGCPKLDDNQGYVLKLAEILRRGTIRSVTVVKMVVPCCGGIALAARQALEVAGKEIPYREITVGIDGGVVS